MKFSFSLIKKLAPGKYDKSKLVEKLNLHSFEAVDLGGDVLEISISPNRYSDAVSHLGIAREAAAIFGGKLSDPADNKFKPDVKNPGMFAVNIKNKNLCRRYMAAYVSGIKIGPSPKWMKDTLESCGIRSINNIVDVMNYVMLEIGQPLHAFDAAKISGGIVVRVAKKGEPIITIDGQEFKLTPENLVIADSESPLAIAGIKGGKHSEVSSVTKNIVVESANFDGMNIYRSSRLLGLTTDASTRFSHQLSPELAEMGLRRALSLLRELAGGKVYAPVDSYPKKQPKEVIKADADKISGIIGHKFSEKEIYKILESLGFKRKGALIEVPPLRADVQNIEDLAEEVIRIHGYDNLESLPPRVALSAASQENQVTLKDGIREFLISVGASEVYNYSFLSDQEASSDAPELLNPISRQSAFLRDSLKPHLIKNLKDNSRFSKAARVFEIGKAFNSGKGKISERLKLGIGILSESGFLEAKGIVEALFGRLGITDYEMVEAGGSLKFSIGGFEVGDLKTVPGLRNAALAELDLEMLLLIVNEEKEFMALPKFPSITRDLSIFVPTEVRVGEILALIQRVSSKLVSDVDLLDYYESPVKELRDRSESPERNKRSLTFRIVFQADDRTLTDAEADREMAVINQVLIDKFDVELR
jgi:phenylalanyl-tRNA synthetase beta chain